MEIKQGTPQGPSAALGRAGPGPWEGEPPWETDSQITGWWFQTCFFFHFIYGMSSFPLTHIFQDCYCTTNQNSSDVWL